MDEGQSHDRRGGTRAPIELKVEYKRLNTFFADYTKNISKGGTFIRTERPLEMGTEFVFALIIPNFEAPLRLLGRVQWLSRPDSFDAEHPAGMGIEFVYKNDDERRKVADVVEALMAQELGESLSAKLLGKLRALARDATRGASDSLERLDELPVCDQVFAQEHRQERGEEGLPSGVGP